MSNSSPRQYLVTFAAFVIVVAGMRAAQSLLIPFLLATFLAIVLAPFLGWLKHHRVPDWLSVIVLVGLLTALGAGVLGVIGNSVTDFSHKLPQYRTALDARIASVESWIDREWNRITQRAADALPDTSDKSMRHEDNDAARSAQLGGPPVDAAANMAQQPGTQPPVDQADDGAGRFDWLNLEWMIGTMGTITAQLGSMLSNASIILITVIFMLLEGSRLPDKLKAALADRQLPYLQVETIVASIRKYMAIKTITSLITGVLAAVLIAALGIDYPLLWGLLAFLFNYVPNIGSIIAAVPPILLALVNQGWGVAAGAGAGYVVINGLVGYVIEPRYMGRGLGLSTLVVFISLVFWGWVLGTVGMFLSAPLTMMVKIVLEHFDETRWLAMLLSARAEPVSDGGAPATTG